MHGLLNVTHVGIMYNKLVHKEKGPGSSTIYVQCFRCSVQVRRLQYSHDSKVCLSHALMVVVWHTYIHVAFHARTTGGTRHVDHCTTHACIPKQTMQ